ncbi:hypothetical protein ACVWZW_005170 [Bradyrhizobium sp. F1.13.4]
MSRGTPDDPTVRRVAATVRVACYHLDSRPLCPLTGGAKQTSRRKAATSDFVR